MFLSENFLTKWRTGIRAQSLRDFYSPSCLSEPWAELCLPLVLLSLLAAYREMSWAGDKPESVYSLHPPPTFQSLAVPQPCVWSLPWKDCNHSATLTLDSLSFSLFTCFPRLLLFLLLLSFPAIFLCFHRQWKCCDQHYDQTSELWCFI